MICRRDNIKLQCKHQPFHAEVATAVCDIFNGQPMRTTTYRLDLGNMPDVQTDLDMTDTGFRNHPLVPELTNSRYDWSNFIIVVPSMAIRGGIYKSLQTTQEHFAEEYGKKIRLFIYSSDRPRWTVSLRTAPSMYRRSTPARTSRALTKSWTPSAATC